ncbi:MULTISPECIES: response regulator [Streptomyces]|uniref:Transcriptional regulatory protein n=1 Tax=Streptomyces evansiae TaxID=3075535 RepID=A0ABD5E5X9_9ACTN|nr:MULTISPECIES: response regulator [unclassified Streptomyces]MYQ58473.1 response regulator [Streptomyces sp. SID4926]MYR27532.1 response regulator [Streptomyces sp. SID4945]MYX24460.1 response regulator [Streptomyces sp. SID8380]ASY36239.1 two-component system response regulator [Streptomyces sp. CLI2509]EFK98326.1 two-component system response regulator [Streptomyces sp. SPB78]
MIRVLVVDDDFHVAEINTAYVSRVPGFTVVGSAHTAAQALGCLERTEVDLVLLDHYLPDETGVQLVRRLRLGGHDTDVIMVTAARDLATVRGAQRFGALQYLVKPFTFAGLRERLEGYAALRRAVDEGAARPEPGQEQIDRIFTGLRGGAGRPRPSLPKGHSTATAALIRTALTTGPAPLSAHEVAARTGIGRSTAQRYLKYLEHSGLVSLTLRYGDTGRPEHLYTWVAGAGRG